MLFARVATTYYSEKTCWVILKDCIEACTFNLANPKARGNSLHIRFPAAQVSCRWIVGARFVLASEAEPQLDTCDVCD